MKKVAQRLLEKVKAAIVLDLFRQKVAALFEHVYESYYGEGKSVYTAVA